jgi:hypothetical protein
MTLASMKRASDTSITSGPSRSFTQALLYLCHQWLTGQGIEVPLSVDELILRPRFGLDLEKAVVHGIILGHPALEGLRKQFTPTRAGTPALTRSA